MKRMLLVGQPFGCLGIPIHFRMMAEGFIKYQTEYDIKILPLYPCPTDNFQAEYGQSQELKDRYVTEEQAREFDPTHLFVFWEPTQVYSKLVALFGRENRCYINTFAFEWDVFSQELVQACNSFDYCSSFSTWGQQVLIKNGIPKDKTFIFHCGIQEDYLESRGHQPNIEDRTRFLFVGKIENRKSFDETILAFDHATIDIADQAHLKLLTFKQFKDIDVSQYIRQIVPFNNNIFPFFARIDSIEKMRGIYNFSDYLLLPSKAGAIELPLLEAQACGCLPIVGRWSGMADYFPPNYPFTIKPKEEVDIYDPTYFPTPGAVGKWTNPDWEHFNSLIKQAINLGRSEYNWQSEQVRNYVLNNFQWKNLIPKFIERL